MKKLISVVLILILAFSLCACDPANPTDTTGGTGATAAYELYWNVDGKDYEVSQDVGSTGREPDADGYYHVLFAKDGEQVDLRVVDRRLVNRIDGMNPALMGLKFDENGIVVDLVSLDDMPLEKVGFHFYVQSFAKNIAKINSSLKNDGMEQILEITEDTLILDVSGEADFVGAVSKLHKGAKVYAIANEEGVLTHIFMDAAG